MSANDGRRTPFDQALDLFVHLPVGMAFELPRTIPRFIERGRRELDAVTGHDGPIGWLDPSARLDRLQAHTVGTLRALGVLHGESTIDHEADGAARVGGPTPTRTVAPAEAIRSVGPDRPLVPAPAADELAIPGYDSLSASQVMPRLASLGAGELDAVRRYEQANRGRRTILNRIAQIQAG